MNKIQLFMLENGKDWKKELEALGVSIKYQHGYYIAKYNAIYDKIAPQFDKEIVNICRGIIFDEDGNIVCRPFKKFFNHDEKWADKIDWKTAIVTPKIDGSLIKLWYDKKIYKWVFSTNGMVYAEDAVNQTGKNFLDLIKDCPEYRTIQKAIEIDILNENCTYIFELVHPENIIVVNYPKPKLYYLTAFDNESGYEKYNYKILNLESEMSKGIHQDECAAFAEVEDMNPGGVVVEEGIVVADAAGHRIKIKSKEYFTLHKVRTVGYTFSDFYDDLQTGNLPISISAMIKYHEYCAKFYALVNDLKIYGDKIRMFYLEKDGDRKLTAEYIKNDDASSILKSYAFAYLNEKADGETFALSFARQIRKNNLKKLLCD